MCQLPFVPTVNLRDEGETVTESVSVLIGVMVKLLDGSDSGTIMYVVVSPSLTLMDSWERTSLGKTESVMKARTRATT